ncbi:Gamma-aminobutyric acid type B receptor subunit 2 [Frankliniella fusca]|uniref:Gamma-aminobutyric acid type B receptor subunit 2 n=1 Tax=Frankliniella fusca TaxID=407009 RepID=A0AAE1HVV9_9NEOP|nr:Gamma-aminobutyric acid type B receptor subunit 2 [Frankliniella fusca]
MARQGPGQGSGGGPGPGREGSPGGGVPGGGRTPRRPRRLRLALALCLLAGLAQLAGRAHAQRPTSTGGKDRHDVYIAGFFPFARNVPESRVGRGVMPSVKLAVDHINENQNVLRNYRLHMWWNDTQVSPAGSICPLTWRNVRMSHFVGLSVVFFPDAKV